MAADAKYTYYFAYGSTVIDEKMDRRFSTLRPEGQAELKGWRFAFGGPDGLPNLVEDAGASVAGLIYLIGAQELQKLDAEEAGYQAQALPLSFQGQPVLARVYTAPPSARQPKAELVAKLKRAYQTALLPLAQIDAALSPALKA